MNDKTPTAHELERFVDITPAIAHPRGSLRDHRYHDELQARYDALWEPLAEKLAIKLSGFAGQGWQLGEGIRALVTKNVIVKMGYME